MCKEGIRIGRRMTKRSQSVALAFAVESQLLPANPNRLGIIIAIDPAQFGSFAEKAIVYTDKGDLTTTFGVHGYGNYATNYGIELYGQIVTGPVYAITAAAGGGTVWVTELFLTEPLVEL